MVAYWAKLLQGFIRSDDPLRKVLAHGLGMGSGGRGFYR